MLGKLTGQHVTDGGLDLTGREGHLLVVGGKLPSLASDALEDVVDERAHDAHPLLVDAGVGVDLLEDLVERFLLRFFLPPLAGTFLTALAGAFLDGVFAMVGNGWRCCLMNSMK